MAAKVLKIDVNHRESVLGTMVVGFEDTVHELRGRGPLATAVRALRRAVRDEEALAGVIDEELSRLEDVDGVELEHWDAEWPFELELRVDLSEAIASQANARRAGGALDRLLAMLATLEGSDVSVQLGRCALDLASARREIAGRAALLGVVLPPIDAPAARDEDDDIDEDEVDDIDDEDEVDGDEDDGFPAGGFGTRARPSTLEPDEAWLICRAGIRWPCGPDELRRAVRPLLCEVHPDRHGDSREAHEEFVRVQRGYELLKTRCAEGGARDAS